MTLRQSVQASTAQTNAGGLRFLSSIGSGANIYLMNSAIANQQEAMVLTNRRPVFRGIVPLAGFVPAVTQRRQCHRYQLKIAASD